MSTSYQQIQNSIAVVTKTIVKLQNLNCIGLMEQNEKNWNKIPQMHFTVVNDVTEATHQIWLNNSS